MRSPTCQYMQSCKYLAYCLLKETVATHQPLRPCTLVLSVKAYTDAASKNRRPHIRQKCAKNGL